MGRLASGARLRTVPGASVVLLWAGVGWAQVPAPPPPLAPPPSHVPGAGPAEVQSPPPQPPPPPAVEPAPPPPNPTRKPPPARSEAPPPPLDPPPPEPAPSRPAFLHTAEEMNRLKPLGTKVARPSPPAPLPAPSPALPEDFVLRSSPWVDFTITSFHLEDRTGNFLNLGVQVGAYAFERLRIAARLVTPLENLDDGYSVYAGARPAIGTQSFERLKARSMSMLYAASVGLLITNSKTFAFGPSIELQRTDVGAYGTALSLGLPFEWTTRKNLRIGFEFALGRAFGGNVKDVCHDFRTTAALCGTRIRERPAGTAVLFQYYMGWSLGRL